MQSVKQIIEHMRRMTVVRAPGTDALPMIKIANRMLSAAGFGIGTAVGITYGRGIITIKTLDHEHQLQEPRSPVSLSAASREADAGESDGHARRGEPSPTDVTKAVPIPVQPLGYVFSGHYYHGKPQNSGLSCREVRVSIGR